MSTIDLRQGPTQPIRLEVTPSPIELVSEPTIVHLAVESTPIELVSQPETILLQVTGVGAQGPPGEPGDSTEQAEAGETISALKPVVILDGIAMVGSAANSAHRGFLAGIATTAATSGNQVTIQTAGRMQDDVWNWDPTKPWVFLGAGVLTQTPPSGWCQVVGRVESSDTIFVEIKQGIER